jgi:2-C-methyl-D-erythritol 4-phosphate cytidylyltransferase
VDAGGESTFQERTNFRLVQTPQTFQVAQLMQAFSVEELGIFTDDATVYEYQGWAVTLIEGNSENIKLTTPEDLVFAEFLMATR